MPNKELPKVTKQSTNPLFGLRWVNGKWTWDKKEVEIIRLVFELAPKYGSRIIAKKLNKMGYRNRQGSSITPRAVIRILSKEEYRQVVGPLYNKAREAIKKRKSKMPEMRKKGNKEPVKKEEENFKKLRYDLIRLVNENRQLRIENEELSKENRRLRAEIRRLEENCEKQVWGF